MADLDVQIDAKQYAKLMNRLSALKPQERLSIVKNAMLAATNLVERGLKTTLTGISLKVRTGKLRQSIGSRVFFDKNGITGVVGSGVRTGKRMSYANIQETGGTITAKKAKFLTIPLQAALTASGAPRKPKARDWENTFVMKTKGGKLLIMQKGATGKLTPLYILKKSVRIPASGYLSNTVKRLENRILVVLGATIEKGLQNV